MYHFNKGTLNMETEWQDKSIILLTNDTGQSISVSYDKLPFGMDFLEFCDREISSLGQQLTDYRETSREESILDKYPLMITVTSVIELTDKQKAMLLDIVRSFKARVEP